MALNYIIAGIVGIVIYQIVCMIVYIITNEDDNIMSIMGMLVPFVIWSYAIQPIVFKLVLSYYRKNYNCYRFCYTTQDGTKDKTLGIFYANAKNIKDISQNEKDKYYVELIRNGKDFKSIPYKSDVYKNQERFKGLDMNLFKNR